MARTNSRSFPFGTIGWIMPSPFTKDVVLPINPSFWQSFSIPLCTGIAPSAAW